MERESTLLENLLDEVCPMDSYPTFNDCARVPINQITCEFAIFKIISANGVANYAKTAFRKQNEAAYFHQNRITHN